MRRISSALVLLAVAIIILAAVPARAAIVFSELNLVNNGNILDTSDAIGVTASPKVGGWDVSVGGGLSFEEFYFNYSPSLTLGNISVATLGWTVDTSGGTASGFGNFDVKLNGPVPGGSNQLDFEILVAGAFLENSTCHQGQCDFFFAAKIASQSSEAGGFVAASELNPVPLPTAGWLMISALMLLLGAAWRQQKEPAER